MKVSEFRPYGKTKSSFIKSKDINGRIVEVTFSDPDPNIRKIGNAWIK
jgi:hypothetical protein